MGLDVEARRRQLLELLPRQRDPGPEEVGVDEQRGREAQLLEERLRVLTERLPAIVEGQNDRLPRELPLEGGELEELLEADGAVALGLQVPHLVLEALGREDEPALRLRPDVVIAEDGDELIAGRERSSDRKADQQHDERLK